MYLHCESFTNITPHEGYAILNLASYHYKERQSKFLQCISAYVGLNSVHREILSSVIIVFYDKVRGRNKAQR